MIGTHPAKLMMRVWAYAWLIFLILPFQLTNTQLTGYGIFVFFLFFGFFCLAACAVKMPPDTPPAAPMPTLDTSRAERWLELVSIVAIIGLAIDIHSKSVFDLAASYAQRSDVADALLNGDRSQSTLAFQVAFLCYPAAYIYIVMRIAFHKKVGVPRLLVFGFLPPVMGSLSMGGRNAFFYAMITGLTALSARRRYFGPQPPKAKRSTRHKLIILAAVLGFLGTAYYFSAVFLVRAEASGGIAYMFDFAEQSWGVGFRGAMSSTIFLLLGDAFTYLLFITIWYGVQGLVMSNIIFTQYHGPAQMGVYGLDLAAAIARRVNGNAVANGFNALMQIGTYGFLPSAFGSLYVDFYFFGLVFVFIWGYLAACACRQVRLAVDSRWLLVGPFVCMGVIFSLINTPLGFTNGLVVHFWLFVCFKKLQSREKQLVISPTSAIA